MFNRMKTEVLIVGAGPVGMMAAAQLAKKGIGVVIIDMEECPCTQSHALLIHPQTLDVFYRLGILDDLSQHGTRIDEIRLFDHAQARESISLEEIHTDYPFALSVPQASLESFMGKELEDLGVTVLWNHRATDILQTDDGIEVKVDRITERTTGYAVSRIEHVIDKTLNIEARFLIAADGFQSLMRRLLLIDTVPQLPQQSFMMFDVDTDEDLGREMKLSLTDELESFLIPMPNGKARLGFEVEGISLPDDLKTKERTPLFEHEHNIDPIDDETLQELIRTRSPWKIGYINQILWRASVPFDILTATELRKGNAILLGDAARTFPPTVSTGLSLGLTEAEKLSHVIERVLNGNALLTDLDRQLSEFHTEWDALYHIGKRSKAIDLADPWIARHRDKIINRLPATGTALETLASEIFIHLTMPLAVDA